MNRPANKLLDYNSYDGLGLAKLVNDGEITAQELLEETIAKAEELNPTLNCITQKLYDYARSTIEKGLPNGPFRGLPLLLKDLGVLCKDTVTTHGSRLFQNEIASLDNEIVKRFKKAGLVIFGKTNTPEFGLSFTTEPLAFGPCRNPWDLNRTTGGSSGGAAAAVAARISPLAHASDGGGSIRVPAACCGIFGLKPTRARVPMGPIVGEGWGGLATYNLLSISLRDSAAVLDIISGAEIGDPYYAPHKPDTYLDIVTNTNINNLNNIKKKTASLKIACTLQFNGDENPEAEIITAFKKTVKLCEELGHEIHYDTPHFDNENLRIAFRIIAASNALLFLKLREKEFGRSLRDDEIEPISKAFAEYGKEHSASDYAKAVFTIQYQSRRIAYFFEKYDLLLTPTTAKLPVPIGELSGDTSDFEKYNSDQIAFSPYTAIANITGQPAISVPLFWSKNNLPIGSHFIGRFGDEKTLFKLAAQLEKAKPWRDKMPRGNKRL